VPSERIVVIANAIDPIRFASETDVSAKRELHLEGKLVLGFVGFVREWHGLASVIDLLGRTDIPAALHLLIVGEGLQKELKEQARKLGVSDRLTFTGVVGRELIARYISAFDMALLPACVDYCSPLKLFEYLAAGKAVIAPDQENIREIVAPGDTCLLFVPGSRDSMAEAILRLAKDCELRGRLGQAGRALIFSRGYTWQRNAERVIGIAKRAIPRETAQRVPALE
jgi:glycosyltransferase involved in cell wall biosynthesis